ncbi:hypothetical protein ACI01nite_18860 [Acetobacter cibinongensis]|uniref:Pilus assembly protein n=1 Tax=Acetobacter cibinongensis TaxID=146475 RepID=A0A0D6N199_9PROT|nr:Flp family type IVb pilin [Acetobacter cibinongensis]GAN59762.1 hypothetical protein Abci_007_165 [Acetobacter cibinongensis]GBQ14976.1 hypothetical protein AA0482_1083 [Acetobacter cibinongensis NRIC 0482]GEL59284.1 hypothetical protein ACI01nite_18860 [Acetobacter cibinongensis]
MIYYKKKIQQEVGATAIEYGILSALIAVVTILGLQATGTNLGTTYCTIANKLSQAVGAGSTASGCSANSSGSGSSGNSGTRAGSSGTSADNSTVMTPASGTLLTPFSNAVSSDLVNFAVYGITTISGFYDANGNKLTTPEQLANSVGVSDDLYNQLVSAITSGTSDYQSKIDAQQAVIDAVTKSGKQYYDKASDITLTNSSGDTYTYQSDDSSKSLHNYAKKVLVGGVEVTTSGMPFFTSKATGD